MTRSKLIELLARKSQALAKADVELVVKTIIETIGDRLAKGDRAEIRGFGSFELSHRPPRKGRNPKTGAPVKVPAKYVPHFKPGKELKAGVNKG